MSPFLSDVSDSSLDHLRSRPSLQPLEASTHKFPPTWHVRSTPSLAPLEKSGYSYTKSAEDAKDRGKIWVKNLRW